MSIRRKVTCINKSDRYNPHERIRNIGGSGWKYSEPQAITLIKSGDCEFYVSVNGKEVRVIIAKSSYGYEYLKTENDGESPNNLLSLPECP